MIATGEDGFQATAGKIAGECECRGERWNPACPALTLDAVWEFAMGGGSWIE
jgi:hypothetical protein